MEIKVQDLAQKKKKLLETLRKNRLLVAAGLLGLLLLLLSGLGGGGSETKTAESGAPGFSLEEQEERFAAALSRIDGAGRVEVVLTLKTGLEREIAWEKDERSTNGGDGGTSSEQSWEAVITGSSGSQTPVTLRYVYPEYQGALVVSQGAGSASVRLALTEAVAALTGLSSDRITVIKMR